jgi:hypothetical protein
LGRKNRDRLDIARDASGHRQALFRVLEDRLGLFAGHAREPLEKIIDAGAIFEVRKEA